MNPESVAVFSLGFTVAGALIAFGIMYGTLKKEQESFKEAFLEFKKEVRADVKSIEKELRNLTQGCHHHSAHRAGNEAED